MYIVGAAGAVVAHDMERNTFAAMREGPDGWVVVPWQLLRPGGAGEQAGLPAYFETDEQGALVQVFAAGPLGTFANLVTFEPEEVIDRRLDQYQAYEERGGGELALVVVPTRGGDAVGSGDALLRAGRRRRQWRKCA